MHSSTRRPSSHIAPVRSDGNLGLIQGKNGPCGVLALINAVMVKQLIGSAKLCPTYRPDDADLATSISTLIKCASESGESATSFKVATWAKDQSNNELGHPAVEFAEVKGDALETFCLAHVDDFKSVSFVSEF